MNKIAESPRILNLSWGRVQVEGQAQSFKDVKLFPGGACTWDWNETGTGHSPGVQPADVQELLDHGAQVVVLSRGYHKRLKVCPETLEMLESRGITTHVLPSPAAVDLYNSLCETELGR